MEFEPRDPHYEERVKDSFARQGFMTHLNAKLDAPAPGACDITIPFDSRVAQQHGYFHGGVVGALADAAGAYAGFTLLPSTATILTVEYKVNLLSPALGEALELFLDKRGYASYPAWTNRFWHSSGSK